MNANMLQVTTPQSRLPELIAAAGARASMPSHPVTLTRPGRLFDPLWLTGFTTNLFCFQANYV
jgi:hypothetical protein